MEMTSVSRVNSQFVATQDNWVVSLFNTGAAYAGHAMLVVEGVDENYGLFVGQYEVSRKFVETETLSDLVQKTIGNSQGFIYTIRVIEGDTYTNPQDYSTFSSRSWYAKPEAIKYMIQSIKDQKEKIEEAKKNNQPLPDLYQAAGSYRWWFLGGNGGESCLTWAEKKLRLADIEPKGSWFDWIKAFPELHVDSK